MPVGVDVIVDDGVATIDFVDTKLRGVGLARLLAVAPAALVEKRTSGFGPRAVYRVPEVFARQAGLLDDAAKVPAEESVADEPIAVAAPSVEPVTKADRPRPAPRKRKASSTG